MGKTRKKKRNAAGVFMQGFLKSVLVIGLLFLTGFASYKVSLFYFNERGVSEGGRAAEVIKELYGTAEVEEISKNLIYSIDEESGKVKSMVLEIFNTKTGNMDYITLPTSTEITISNELYQKLVKGGCEAPQIIRLSRMNKYFSEDTLYEYGELILNDLLGIDISYYTVLEHGSFRRMFEKSERKETVQTEETAVIQTMPVWMLSEKYKSQLEEAKQDEKTMKDYIETSCEDVVSNLPVRSRKKYAEDYLKWETEKTHYHVLPCVAGENKYQVMPEEAKALTAQILGNPPYTEKQDNTAVNTTVDSRECSIQILNASQINGLAAEYQTLLTEQGYTVDSIGNYMGQMQEVTSILVRSTETGADLLGFFEGSTLTVSEALPEGIDIQIILGTDADKEAN